jgi:DNA transformation protein
MKRGSGRSPKLAAFVARNGPQDHSVRLRRTASHPHRFDDLFQFFGPITVRRMFGGEGIYAGDVMIGLVAGERLYLKTTDLNRADFAAEGCEAFCFPRGEKTMVTSYYAVPERLFDDPEEFSAWARKAHAAALAAKTPRRKRR